MYYRNIKLFFATSLKEVKSLKADPYAIKVTPGIKPIKVTPRMLAHVETERLKDYIKQLMELGMVETCSGPWAAAVVLVPNDKDKDKETPHRRFRKMKKMPKIVSNKPGGEGYNVLGNSSQ